MPTADRNWDDIAQRLQGETLLPLTEAARLCPADNRRGYCSTNALANWIFRGKLGVHLEALRVSGKTWWTTKEALARFWAAVSQAEVQRRQRSAVTGKLPDPDQADRERRAAAASAELRKICG